MQFGKMHNHNGSKLIVTSYKTAGKIELLPKANQNKISSIKIIINQPYADASLNFLCLDLDLSK